MTENLIDELRLRYRDAEHRASQAEAAAVEAKNRLSDALIEKGNAEWAARGITPGTRVVARRTSSGGTTEVEGIFVGLTFDVWSSHPRPIVRKIKKDGTAHASHDACKSWDATWERAE